MNAELCDEYFLLNSFSSMFAVDPWRKTSFGPLPTKTAEFETKNRRKNVKEQYILISISFVRFFLNLFNRVTTTC